MPRRLLALGAFCWLAACDRGGAAEIPPATAEVRPLHVDSILPLDEDLRRLRQGMMEPLALTGAAPSVDQLVERLLTAVAARDRAALDRLTITPEEFAWFYYPAHPQAQPPTRLGSGVMWMMIRENSDKGAGALLGKLGGQPLDVASRECAAPSPQGGNTIIYPCRFTIRGMPGTVRLFGEILARPEGYKLVSLANTLD